MVKKKWLLLDFTVTVHSPVRHAYDQSALSFIPFRPFRGVCYVASFFDLLPSFGPRSLQIAAARPTYHKEYWLVLDVVFAAIVE